MKRRVCILSNGTITDGTFLREQLGGTGDSVIICADGALRYLVPLGYVPAVIIGDMDSADDMMIDACVRRGSIVHRYPPDKTQTDTELAFEEAFDMEPDEILLFGALGGRLDHSLANISLLVKAAKRRVTARIIDESCEVFVVWSSCEVRGDTGDTVSFLPLSTRVTGITLDGFRYPLEKAEMEVGVPYGVSNILTKTAGRVSVESGHLLVIRQFGVL